MPTIQDIEIAEQPLDLQIRVIRKWTTYSMTKELCYLLLDIHRDAIEATADLKKESYFDSKMTLQQCYTISNYIAIPNRKYMRVVPHDASIRLGDKVIFQALSDTNIPTYYYNFVTYEELESRKPSPKPLTDYIGRIEKVSPVLIRADKRIKKVTIQDEGSHLIEVNFWSESMFPYEKEEATGQVLAITSTIVTEYLQKLQLESTPATVTEINPQIPNLQTYINRFSQLRKSTAATPQDHILTITDIFNKYNDYNKQTRFTCKASITEIIPNQKWYYVTCPTCQKKLYLQKGEAPKFVCEDDGIIAEPAFMYCVNTTIADETKDAKAVFFNEAMTEILDITCKNMVINHGHTNPSIIPPEIYAIRGKPFILHISMKKDYTMNINRATKSSTFTPTTPNTKAVPSKRQFHHSPDADTPSKQIKA